MPARVLLIGAERDEIAAVLAMAREHYLVEVFGQRQAAAASIASHRPDLILLAHLTPPGDELALLQELRSEPGTSTLPVLLLSRPEDEDFRIEGLRAGASDHLCEPFGAGELLARIEVLLSASLQRTDVEVFSLQGSEALRAQQLLRAFVHQSSDGIIIIDRSGTVLEWNEGEERITGIPRTEAVSRSIGDVQHRLSTGAPQGFELARIATEKTLVVPHEGIEPGQTVEREIKRLDGSIRVVQSVLFDIRSGGELLVGIISRDVTEARRASQKLLESEERLALAIAASGQGLWDWDIVSDTAYLSPEYRNLTGYTDVQVRSAAAFFRSIIHPDELLLVTKAVQDNLAGRSQRAIVESRVLKKSGDYFWTRTLGQVTGRDQHGAPTRMTGVLVDISQRRSLEEELREREALLLEAERLAGLGHWDRDLRSGASHWSDEIYRILGYVPGSISSSRETFLQALDYRDRERVGAALNATAQDGVTRRGEFRVVSLAGSVRHVMGTVELLRDADGAPARVIGTIQDITERKKMEQRLAESSRRKDQFLAVLSHELRNPLAPIRSSLDVLSRAEPGGDQARRMLALIERQFSHLTRLVDDLLDITRISRGKIQLRRERIELTELVKRTVDDYRLAFEAAAVHLETRLACGPIWIDGDPTRVAQMLGNLLTNSVKFTPSGGQVEVVLEVGQDGGAILSVRDNGVGINGDILPHLFEPFTQADRSIERARGGLGLGLALVKGLAELHGGSVTATSKGPGLGAQFVIRLPVASSAATSAPAPVRRRTQPRRILLIEDNIDAAGALKEALQSDGHQVEVAYNGPDGLAKARVFAPDAILCDIGLPGISGFEVAQVLRADEQHKGTFLAALTGYALPDDVQRAKQAGFDRHLVKPFSLEDLSALLSEIPSAEERSKKP